VPCSITRKQMILHVRQFILRLITLFSIIQKLLYRFGNLFRANKLQRACSN